MKKDYIRFVYGEERKVPVFRNRHMIPPSTIERSIVMGMNKIEDEQVKERMRNMISVQVQEEENYAYLDVYDDKGKCCRLELKNTMIGIIVDHVEDDHE